ncbi:MAG: nucleotide exchange factor GrpE [Clostridiales Family XIII bacterium]|jgi:molecular chaperone GrpE|nr:nucleotide exchange factor GrpE [Clostridiales Family XIII bacterium]
MSDTKISAKPEAFVGADKADSMETAEKNEAAALINQEAGEAGSHEESGNAEELEEKGEPKQAAPESGEKNNRKPAKLNDLNEQFLGKITPQSRAANISLDELTAKYVRLAADFQNYKKRVEKEKSDIYTYANEKIVIGVLEVIDNFERALEHSPETAGADESYTKGMEMIFKQLWDVLSKNDVEEISSLGEEFDPNLHHAVMMEESEDYESGRVSGVLGKGYKIREKVIRPAMVKVAK